MTKGVIELVSEVSSLAEGKPVFDNAVRPHVLGTTHNGRQLVGLRIGDGGGPVCAVVAGMHSDEVTGVAAAMQLVHSAPAELPAGVELVVVPVVDVDGVIENGSRIERDTPVESLLSLRSHRDLEGDFCDSDRSEVRAVRRWLSSLPRLDAYVSLHAVNHLAPGGFSYLDGRHRRVIETVAAMIGARMAALGVPRLASDPTGKGGAKIEDGVFEIPRVPGSSLDFARRRFDPAVLAVTEIPVGLVEPHGPIALEKLDVWRRAVRDGAAPRPGDIIPVADAQISLLGQIVVDVCRAVAVAG